MLKEFKQFLLRGNVIDLAVAVVIGAAFNNVVQAFVRDIFTPLVSIFGNPKFSGLQVKIGNAEFTYGDLLNAIISFLLVAVVVYFFVMTPVNKLISLARLQPTPDPTTRKCPECLSEIPINARRCAFCTAVVKAEKPPKLD